MPPKKFAPRFSLSIPPFLISFSKDLVVFWTPRRALIERSIQRLLESANLSPQLRSFEAWLVLQNSFDRIVRTGSATLHPFAQNSIDLFRGEKPERIATRCISPTVYHHGAETHEEHYLHAVGFYLRVRRVVSQPSTTHVGSPG